jgi:methyltransferase (TIGR00027 family)
MERFEASRTAILVCQGRAVADGRLAPALFADPTAAQLLRPEELEAVSLARSGQAPRGLRARMDYETMRAAAEVMVPRTVAIDAAVRERNSAQVVILGAGLDGRAWRMPELAEAIVFEVDHPASQADKQARVGAMPPAAREVRFVAMDFRQDSLTARLREAGHRPDVPTTWIWEGVVPYLTRSDVVATLGEVTAVSAEESRLVVNYQVPALASVAGRWIAGAMRRVGGQPDVFDHEPHRSKWRPDEMCDLLAEGRFYVVRDDDLLAVASRIGLQIRNHRSVGHGRVTVADR